jgi:polar amino acid transport system substrate-binding protein
MKLRILLAAMTVCLIATMPVAQAGGTCERVVISGDPNYAPFSWYEGNSMRGAALEIVTHALIKIGLPYETRYVGPFARVMQDAQHGLVDIIVEMKNIPERQQAFEFSHTAIFLNPIAIFTRADEEIPYHEWNDLRGLRGGITNANRFGSDFDSFIAQNLTIETANDIKGNFDKLGHRHIDYFITAYYPGMNYLMQQKRQGEFKVLRPYAIESANFVGWSKASSCLPRLAELDQTLSEMEAGGEIEEIVNRYLDAWRKGNPAPVKDNK